MAKLNRDHLRIVGLWTAAVVVGVLLGLARVHGIA